MTTIVYTGLNPFNFIPKHFLQICRYRNPHSNFLVMQGFFSCTAWGFSDDHNPVFLCVNIPERWNQASYVKKVTSRISTVFVWIKYVNHSQHRIRFYMIRRFQFLHCCYFLWEEFQFFSDSFMRCCKPDNFLLRQLAQWPWWIPPRHTVRNVHQLLTVNFRWSPTSFGV
jgi:hypothetical protein